MTVSSKLRSQFAKALAITFLGLGIAPQFTSAATYDAAADFSSTSNPNGVWSYGWTETLGSTLNVYSNVTQPAGIDAWIDPARNSLGAPTVAHNGTANPIQPAGSNVFAPGQLAFHPGSNNEYSVIRWTAPNSGSYTIAAEFVGIDFSGPTTTDVHILKNGVSLFDGGVNSFGGTPVSYSSAGVSLSAGDTIDFTVGYGNGSFFFDATGVSAKISTVPLPAAVWLMISGLGVVVSVKRRGKQN